MAISAYLGALSFTPHHTYRHHRPDSRPRKHRHRRGLHRLFGYSGGGSGNGLDCCSTYTSHHWRCANMAPGHRRHLSLSRVAYDICWVHEVRPGLKPPPARCGHQSDVIGCFPAARRSYSASAARTSPALARCRTKLCLLRSQVHPRSSAAALSPGPVARSR